MIGPIRSRRLPAEIKLQITRAVLEAKQAGMSIERACQVILLDSRRLRRWLQRARDGRPADRPDLTGKTARQGCDPAALTEADLVDRPPVARRLPHRLTEGERREILRAGDEERLAHLRHRKLCHTLSREGRAWVSESSVLRVLRQAGRVPLYIRPTRPTRPRPEVDESEPNRSWRYDLTRFPTRAGDYHLVPVIDGCSRKIVGRHFGPEATSRSVQTAWEKALAAEGLLGEEAPPLPQAVSDRGTQMTSKSTQAFFAELGIAQSFSRPRTPTDNATCESWMATLKCERLYEADTAELSPWVVEEMVDRFIDYYNSERLHQALGFVTPAERHEGRHLAIIAARREGMREARKTRRQEAYGGVRES